MLYNSLMEKQEELMQVVMVTHWIKFCETKHSAKRNLVLDCKIRGTLKLEHSLYEDKGCAEKYANTLNKTQSVWVETFYEWYM